MLYDDFINTLYVEINVGMALRPAEVNSGDNH